MSNIFKEKDGISIKIKINKNITIELCLSEKDKYIIQTYSKYDKDETINVNFNFATLEKIYNVAKKHKNSIQILYKGPKKNEV